MTVRPISSNVRVNIAIFFSHKIRLFMVRVLFELPHEKTYLLHMPKQGTDQLFGISAANQNLFLLHR